MSNQHSCTSALAHLLETGHSLLTVLAKSFLKIGHLTVSRVPDFRDNCGAISSALHHVVLQSTKASAATYGLDCR